MGNSYIVIPYRGKFWIGANFHIFRMMPRHMKIKAAKFLYSKFLSCQILNRQFLTWYIDRALALYWYFQPLGALPDPSGPLFAHVSPAAIKDANKAVRNMSQGSSKPRGK